MQDRDLRAARASFHCFRRFRQLCAQRFLLLISHRTTLMRTWHYFVARRRGRTSEDLFLVLSLRALPAASPIQIFYWTHTTSAGKKRVGSNGEICNYLSESTKGTTPV